MPPPDHMWSWHRSESVIAWQFSYLDRRKEFDNLHEIENTSTGVEAEVVDLSAT